MHPTRILLVEDDLNVQELLCAIFESEKHQIFVAANPTEACERIQAGAPDIMLLDIALRNELNGLEIYRELRASQATTDVPIVMLTAKGQMGTIKSWS